MKHYMLWATGEDQKGIVAAVTKTLWQKNCNLEDTSMMRLGGEFSVLAIFSSTVDVSVPELEKAFLPLNVEFDLTIGIKKITSELAKSKPTKKNAYIVRVHGKDQKGLVFTITQCLAKNGFNITDLSSHQMGAGKNHGYVMMIEGELNSPKNFEKIKSELEQVSKQLKVICNISALQSISL